MFDPIQGTAVQPAFWLEYHRLCDELGAGHGLTQDRIMAQTLHDLIVRGASVTPDELKSAGGFGSGLDRRSDARFGPS